jgi:hypothetical protein
MIIASDSNYTLNGYSVEEHNCMFSELIKVTSATKTTKKLLVKYMEGNLRHFQHLYLGNNKKGLPNSDLMLHCMKMIDDAARSNGQKFTSVLNCWIDEYGDFRYVNKPLRWQNNFLSLEPFGTSYSDIPF